jgi:ubiquinone/menaquinone biosynthesis C-methylase UbiE
MDKNNQINADRFLGFADIYDDARPQCPQYVIDIIKKYLGHNPNLVVDLGCGTGLSTLIWNGISNKTIGIEPSVDMLTVARKKAENMQSVEFIQAFANSTGLADTCADVVTCSQAFHWLEPQSTLHEVNRILKPNGIFVVYDCDWPPVCNWKAELAYKKLAHLVTEIETTNHSIKDTFIRWNKGNHLTNIKNSGYFTFVREIVFANRELCTAERFIAIILSQGSVQAILKKQPETISIQLDEFETEIKDIFKDKEFEIDFCYRMRVGVKFCQVVNRCFPKLKAWGFMAWMLI